MVENAKIENSNETFWVIFKHSALFKEFSRFIITLRTLSSWPPKVGNISRVSKPLARQNILTLLLLFTTILKIIYGPKNATPLSLYSISRATLYS